MSISRWRAYRRFADWRLGRTTPDAEGDVNFDGGEHG